MDEEIHCWEIFSLLYFVVVVVAAVEELKMLSNLSKPADVDMIILSLIYFQTQGRCDVNREQKAAVVLL